MFCWGWFFLLLLMIATRSTQAVYCDCGSMTGRPAVIPEGVTRFDEDDRLTENQETHPIVDDCPADDPRVAPCDGNTRYMTDVLQIDVERTDGYADRDGLWNDSDPFAILRFQATDGSWDLYGQPGIVGGCDGEACDSVLNWQVRIAVDRSSLYPARVEIWDDDPDWQCWAKTRIRYEDNGIADPVWIEFPQGSASGQAIFSWDNPEDRSGIHHSEIHFSSDEEFNDSDEAVFRVWGETDDFTLDAQHALASGSYFCAVVTVDNHGYDSDIIATGSLIQWNAPTAAPPSATPTPLPSYNAPTPAPGAFVVGDACFLYATLCNNTLIPVEEVPCFVILEAYGQYYFAPGWTTGIDCLSVDLIPGPQTLHIIPTFSWPQIPGSLSDLRFHAGLMNSDMTTLIGEYDTWEFGWE